MIKVLKVINALKKAGLIKDYAIGGGYALNYYLEPILTFDLDIFILIDTEKDYSALYEYFRTKRYKIENVYIVIGELPVQFLPSYIHPLIAEAIKKAKRIRLKGTQAKILGVEYLIATLLMAYRTKDRVVIPQLLKQADKKILKNIIKRFSDEKTPLDKRLRKILESIQ
jgi:predicted nucleotidyltransferase